ncbi:MAG: iron-containing alcohol dehydrogenase [Tepidisphaeraceae bacterium]
MADPNRILTLTQPRKLVFGPGCATDVVDDVLSHGRQRVLVVTSKPTRSHCEPVLTALAAKGVTASLYDDVPPEPSVADFRSTLSAARDMRADAVLGLGGGSAMDVAKLVAALVDSDQDVRDSFGIGKLARPRKAYLACLPTTAGTGSEVSPNAILLDEAESLKKGVISPHLMSDAALVDPLLTLTVPAPVTGATGIDALTHCIEAYANKLAHPLIDTFAIEGIRLINGSLTTAYDDGSNVAARSAMVRGSLYGGICLGPVNTGAIHALSYPLGSEFHVPHGVANAMLMTAVLAFNLPAAPDRYADIAVALGVTRTSDDLATAKLGLDRLKQLAAHCGIPTSLRSVGVTDADIERLARAR